MVRSIAITTTLFTETTTFVFKLKTMQPLPLSVRPKYSVLTDLSCSILLVLSTSPYTYCPIRIFGHLDLLPVTITHGDRTLCRPPLRWSEFTRTTTSCTISIIKRFGIVVYGMVNRTTRILSFTNLSIISITSTCQLV